ncbi:hypothetical protein IDN20_004238 [Salmonella enterica]|nr:hypothetical protein [Salmonella enterica]
MSLWMGILTFSLLCLCLFLQLRQVNRFLREHNAPALPTRLSDSVSLLFLLLGMFLVYQGNMHALLMFTALLPLLWLDAWQHWLPLRLPTHSGVPVSWSGCCPTGSFCRCSRHCSTA